MTTLLDQTLIEKFANQNQWFFEENKLIKQFVFDDFQKSLDFINKVAVEANKQNHHPQILIDYNQVVLSLWTHSLEGVTQKDLDLAQSIDNLLTN